MTSPYWNHGDRKRSLVKVALACGCSVAARDTPMSPRQKFICRSGAGHGYSQPWTSYEFEGATTLNLKRGES